jgi:hypothetical protein
MDEMIYGEAINSLGEIYTQFCFVRVGNSTPQLAKPATKMQAAQATRGSLKLEASQREDFLERPTVNGFRSSPTQISQFTSS